MVSKKELQNIKLLINEKCGKRITVFNLLKIDSKPDFFQNIAS